MAGAGLQDLQGREVIALGGRSDVDIEQGNDEGSISAVDLVGMVSDSRSCRFRGREIANRAHTGVTRRGVMAT